MGFGGCRWKKPACLLVLWKKGHALRFRISEKCELTAAVKTHAIFQESAYNLVPGHRKTLRNFHNPFHSLGWNTAIRYCFRAMSVFPFSSSFFPEVCCWN